MTEERRPPPTERKSGSEYADALSDVLDDQHKREERRQQVAPHPTRRQLSPMVAPALAAISFWLWVFPPAPLQPTPPPQGPVAVQEAGLRMEMSAQLARIQRFVRDNGRLPSSLQETQEAALTGVEYIPLADSTFRLRGNIGGVTIDYVSTQPAEELLRDAIDVVTNQRSGG